MKENTLDISYLRGLSQNTVDKGLFLKNSVSFPYDFFTDAISNICTFKEEIMRSINTHKTILYANIN